jgi:lipopolysaccharide export LptBFGC system permease protein LptF
MILNRHIIWELFKATFLAVAVLTILLLYGNLTRYEDVYFKAMDQRSAVVLELSFLLVPYALSMAIPFGFTIALAFMVGSWASNREFLAIKALGISSFSVARSVFIFSFLLSIMGLYCTLEWGPVSRAKFDEMREKILWENLSYLLVEEGEISFPIDQSKDSNLKRSLKSLLGNESGEINRVTLSVKEFSEQIWQNLRITLFDNENRIQMVINSGKTFVTKSFDKGFLSLDLHEVDFEPVHQGTDFFRGGSDLFLKISHWKQPMELEISEGKKKNLKRLSFFELLNKATDLENLEESRHSKSILHKNTAVGMSPLFITILLLPVSTLLGRKEGVLNLFFGIVICVSFYAIGTITANLLDTYKWSYLAWWAPNILFLCSSLFLIRSSFR